MSTFLNINLEKKISLDLAFRHFCFLFFWSIGISMFLFRIDLIFLEKTDFEWMISYTPVMFFLFVFLYLLFNPWYYILAFLLYPLLLIFWFIPKTILTIGKIYMFGNYVNSLVSSLHNIKYTIFHLCLLILTFLIFCISNQNIARIFVMISVTYFFINYLYRLLKKAFTTPSIFGQKIEDVIQKIVNREDKFDSFLLKSIIINKEDEKLEMEIRREKQIRRVLIFNFCAELFKQKIVGHRGKQAYITSWLFSSFIFMFYSIIFFSFINIQLYKVNPESFIYMGNHMTFDFFYYTLKTITFGDIEIIKPISIMARILEICCFFVIGIFILVVFLSIILSMKQERLNENLQLTTKLIDFESTNVKHYVEKEFGSNLQSLAKEVKNIDDSLKNIKSYFDRLF